MEPRFDGPFDSSNAFESENQSMPESFVDFEDDCDFSDGVLRYIDQMLMEEDMEDETHMLQESFDFQAKERSFYEVIGQKYPPPEPDNNHSYVDNYHNITTSGSDGSGYVIDVVDPTDYDAYRANSIVCNTSISSSTPSGSKNLGVNPEKCDTNEENNNEANIENSHVEEGRKKVSEEVDDVWVYTLGGREKEFAANIKDLKNAASKRMQQTGQVEGPNAPNGRHGKKRNGKKIVVDLISLLMNCAQFVAAGDHRSANELLRQIRQHSSPFGDGNQRLAHYFADGLEARLAGTGSEIHAARVHEGMTPSDYMRAYCATLISSSFRRILNFASNRLIMIKSEKATKVHIIDFGIFYGFQWPTFIQRVAEREGGPPKLRITGIDFPQPGFQPGERIEDMGRRLARYAKTFNVPFEYNAIAQNWETIKIQDLKIEKGEFVAVNCSYLSKNLVDETDGPESSKNMVLDLIRKINPDIFIHGIVNAAYGVPFFVTRFREVLFHFSALFDMVETILPRERPERMLIERDYFGKEALNVIACEGWERVERPETYKQWQVRHLRAGFMLVPFEKKLIDTIMYMTRKFYHRDFMIVEENKWLLMSWKGRTICAISCWQPV
ncbi:scarecrow-like protein 9 [Phtheirospermum japonicum]|uniref:Scarecrow-like protein 9 n=1 Tax=Phtheirospermum japonicum TaxID=374723 RepID=A0A830CBB6_9LAMI|nr:scarecrow-like protein 9 [Phtheirospermum japonicum]